jgi:hypothetical protein
VAGDRQVHAALGLGFRLAFPLPGLPLRRLRAGAPIVDVLAVSEEQLLERWSGAAGEPLWQTIFEDGAGYVVQDGAAGDHLIEYADRPAFHLSADGLSLSCVDPPAQSAAWQRTLTDSVLWSVALLHGAVLLHASAVEGPGGAVAIVAAQGGGKSSLAAALALEGWPLATDDILAFERRGEQIVAHPGPNLMNVSRKLGSKLPADALGEVLATFTNAAASEDWVLVRRFSNGELPLAAVVLLKRAGSQAATITRIAATTLDVTPHTLAFRKMAGSPRRRFEAVSDLVERVPVFCVQAGVEVPPSELAAMVRAAL